MSRADEIFDSVTSAMQDAEEMGGVEGKDYSDLMKRISAEALDRIETYSKWRGLSVPHLAAIVKDEILEDVRHGAVPRTVGSFSELHDYKDANCYGDLCKDHFNDMLRELCGGDDAFIAFVNAVQDDVDHWIKQGHIIRELGEESAMVDRLRADYPHKLFHLDKRGGIFLVTNGMVIHDPTISECGRFPSDDCYGLSTADALELKAYNERRGIGEEN